MIELFDKKEDCCGCSSCENICPVNAIEMIRCNEGFRYPAINHSVCISCKKCINVCPFKKEEITNTDVVSVTPHFSAYAVKHKDNMVRLNSSSGGAFTAFSDLVLKKNLDTNIIKAVLYGVSFDEQFNVRHKRATTIDERDEFRGSKYVQSNLARIFSDIKIDLEKNKEVMFSGTPCQVAGLKNYLVETKTQMDNLILIDIICTGVSSPRLWEDYKQFIENKYRSSIHSFSFRYKKKSWKGYPIRAEFKNGVSKTDNLLLSSYRKFFFSNMSLRPSCYECKYANSSRVSDITLGDFWGIEECLPTFNDKKGISLIIINTDKGSHLFEKAKQDIEYKNAKDTTYSDYQHTLKHPTIEPKNRNVFWCDYNNKGFNYIIKKYGGYSNLGKIKHIGIGILSKLKLLSIVYKIYKNVKR